MRISHFAALKLRPSLGHLSIFPYAQATHEFHSITSALNFRGSCAARPDLRWSALSVAVRLCWIRFVVDKEKPQGRRKQIHSFDSFVYRIRMFAVRRLQCKTVSDKPLIVWGRGCWICLPVLSWSATKDCKRIQERKKTIYIQIHSLEYAPGPPVSLYRAVVRSICVIDVSMSIVCIHTSLVRRIAVSPALARTTNNALLPHSHQQLTSIVSNLSPFISDDEHLLCEFVPFIRHARHCIIVTDANYVRSMSLPSMHESVSTGASFVTVTSPSKQQWLDIIDANNDIFARRFFPLLLDHSDRLDDRVCVCAELNRCDSDMNIHGWVFADFMFRGTTRMYKFRLSIDRLIKSQYNSNLVAKARTNAPPR